MRDTNDPLLLGFGSGLVVEQVRLHSQDLHTLMLLSQRVGLASDTPKHRTAAAIVDYQEAQIKLKAIQDSLRPNIDGKTISAIGITPSGPLRDVLHMEREKLMEYVTVLLTDMSSSCRLAEYTDQALARLEKKATMLQQYLGEDSAFTVHLSVFRHPQRFLAALIRQTAQDKQRDVSEVCLKYEVRKAHFYTAVVPPLVRQTNRHGPHTKSWPCHGEYHQKEFKMALCLCMYLFVLFSRY